MWCVFPCRLFLGAGRLTLAITFGFDISPDRWQIHTMSLLILKADIHERGRQVSALGHKQTFAAQNAMSALPPKADMCSASHVRYVPCVDGSELARAFFTLAGLVGAAMCSAC